MGGRVDADDLDVLTGDEAGLLDRLDGADGLLVVVTEDARDLSLVVLEERLHHGLRFGHAPVAGLAVDDLDTAVAPWPRGSPPRGRWRPRRRRHR